MPWMQQKSPVGRDYHTACAPPQCTSRCFSLSPALATRQYTVSLAGVLQEHGDLASAVTPHTGMAATGTLLSLLASYRGPAPSSCTTPFLERFARWHARATCSVALNDSTVPPASHKLQQLLGPACCVLRLALSSLACSGCVWVQLSSRRFIRAALPVALWQW